jgi:hypothetical protein
MGSAGDALSLNRYLFAEGNPATMVDPTGHMALSYTCVDECITFGTPTGSSTTTVIAPEPIDYCDIPGNCETVDNQTPKPAAEDEYFVDVTSLKEPATTSQVDAMSVGQLQVYLAMRSDACGGLTANFMGGCSDYRYAYCSLAARAGGSLDCAGYASPTEPGTELAIDTALVALAVTLGRAGPAFLQWLKNNPDKIAGAPQYALNFLRGRQYEEAGLRFVADPKNWNLFSGVDRLGRLRNTIPDSITHAFNEFKDVLHLVDRRGQISAMADAAITEGRGFNIFASPRLQDVSRTVFDAVDAARGSIWILDPVSGMISCYYGSCVP